MRRINLSMIPWEGDEAPVRSELEVLLLEDGFDPFAWVDEPGKKYDSHMHEHDESIWIVRGSMDFDVGSQRFQLKAGDRLTLPRGQKHAAVAGPEGCEYLIGQKRG